MIDTILSNLSITWNHYALGAPLPEFLLLAPFVLGTLLFLFRYPLINTITLNVYAIFHLLAIIGLYTVGFKVNVAWPMGAFLTEYFGVDALNLLFLSTVSVLFLAVVFYSHWFMKSEPIDRGRHTHYTAGLLFFMGAMTAVLLTNHLGMAWIGIEATTLATTYIIYFHKTRHSLEAAWKYIFLCSLGIALAFIGLIFMSLGTPEKTLFYRDLVAQAAMISPFWLKIAFVFLVVGFGTKAGLSPMHAWLPDAHSEAPSPVSALLSGALLNASFLIILKVSGVLKAAALWEYGEILLLIIGALSLFIAAIYIFNSHNYKRMLAYSSVENMGIMAIGVALGGGAIYAMLLHMMAHSFTKGAFFLTAGNIVSRFKTKYIGEVGHLVKRDPVTGWCWILAFVALVGFPPSAIFLSKYLMIKEMVMNGQWALLSFFLFCLVVILFGLAKAIFKMAYGEDHGKAPKPLRLSVMAYISPVILLGFVFTMGLYMPPFVSDMLKAAAGLL